MVKYEGQYSLANSAVWKMAWCKNGYGHRTLQLAALQEEVNGIKWLLMCWYKLRKAKSYFTVDSLSISTTVYLEHLSILNYLPGPLNIYTKYNLIFSLSQTSLSQTFLYVEQKFRLCCNYSLSILSCISCNSSYLQR